MRGKDGYSTFHPLQAQALCFERQFDRLCLPLGSCMRGFQEPLSPTVDLLCCLEVPTLTTFGYESQKAVATAHASLFCVYAPVLTPLRHTQTAEPFVARHSRRDLSPPSSVPLSPQNGARDTLREARLRSSFAYIIIS